MPNNITLQRDEEALRSNDEFYFTRWHRNDLLDFVVCPTSKLFTIPLKNLITFKTNQTGPDSHKSVLP